jgi:hypothetical protein
MLAVTPFTMNGNREKFIYLLSYWLKTYTNYHKLQAIIN